MVVVPFEGEAIASAMLGVLEWGSMPRLLLEERHAAQAMQERRAV